jgi:MFS family permease
MGASMVWLWIVRDVWMLYLFALSYGVFHGIRIASGVGVLTEIFGIMSLGELIGITAAVNQVTGSLAPYVTGIIFDSAGSYTPIFLIGSLLAMVAALVAVRLEPMAPIAVQRRPP